MTSVVFVYCLVWAFYNSLMPCAVINAALHVAHIARAYDVFDYSYLNRFCGFPCGLSYAKTLHLEHMKRLQNLSAQLMSYLSGIDRSKSQQMSPWVKAETEKLNQLLLECRLKITRIQVFFMPVLDYANDLLKIIILGLGGFMLMRQELTLGEITAF